MRVLIIDNNIDPECWGSPDLLRLTLSAGGASVFVRRGPQDDLPRDSSQFDRIVISGSRTSAMADAPWIFRLHEFIREAIDRGKPLLGVCYGHQALVRSLGGKESVRKGSVPEFGWTEIEVLEPSPLMRDIASRFHSFSAHFEEVATLPKGMRRLARSEGCEIQACALEGKLVFGIQFHPEKDLEDARKTLRERKRLGSPSVLLNENAGDRLCDPKLGETLFRNFLNL